MSTRNGIKRTDIKHDPPCEAVMMLMQRMETHPEDFSLNGGDWKDLMAHIKERVVDNNKNRLVVLSDMECEMVWGKFKAAGKKQLLSYVMQRILGAKKDE